MSFGAPFGGDATQFGGLPPEVLAALQQLQVQQQAQAQAPQAIPQTGSAADAGPGSPDALLYNRAPMGGGLNPFVAQDAGPATTGATPDPNVPVAMTEADTRQMERAMLPRERAAPAPAPAPAPQVQGMNPDRAPAVPGVPSQPSISPASTGNADASNIAPVNSFDPLTGQPVSGSPKLMRAPGEGGPTEGGARVAAAAGNPAAAGPGGSLFEKFAQGLNNPQVGNLLLNVGIGLMSERGFGPGIAAGLKGYQASSTGNIAQQLQLLKYQQALKGQQDLAASLKARGLPDHVVAAAVANPTVLSDALSSLKPNLQTIGGYVYDLNKGGGVPSDANRVGPADRPDAEQLDLLEKKKTIEDRHGKPQFVKTKDEQGNEHVYVAGEDEGGNTTLSVPKGLSEPAPGSGNPFATGKFNDTQGKAAGFADRMIGAEQILRDHENINRNALGATVQSMLPNSMKPEDRQSYEQAKRSFINAQLRRESGASIQNPEFESAERQYFPQPGEGPKIIEQKRQERQRAIAAMGREGGSAYRPSHVFDDAGNLVPFGQRPQQAPQAAPQAAPQTPAQPSRAQLEAEARRRGLIK